MLAVLRPSISEAWNKQGWVLATALAAGYLAIGLWALEAFVRTTVLTEAGVRQRSMFGSWRFLPYQEIREIEVSPGDYILMRGRAGRKIKIHGKEGDPETIARAISRLLDPEARIITL